MLTSTQQTNLMIVIGIVKNFVDTLKIEIWYFRNFNNFQCWKIILKSRGKSAVCLCSHKLVGEHKISGNSSKNNEFSLKPCVSFLEQLPLNSFLSILCLQFHEIDPASKNDFVPISSHVIILLVESITTGTCLQETACKRLNSQVAKNEGTILPGKHNFRNHLGPVYTIPDSYRCVSLRVTSIR